MSTEAFQAGVAALKSGNKALAREHLMKVVEQDETNEQAWLYLAGALEDPDEIRISLENALHINPQSNRAKQGLEWLRKQHPAIFVEPSPALPEATPPAYTGATLALADLPLADKPLPGQPITQTPFPTTQPLGQAPLPATQPLGNGPLPATQQLAPPALGEVPDVLPCPRCGAPTRYVDQRCRQCSMNLTIKADRQAPSRAPAIIAAILSMLPALLWTFLAILIFVDTFQNYNDFQKSLRVIAPPGLTLPEAQKKLQDEKVARLEEDFSESITPVLNLGVVFLLIGVFGIVMGIALIRRKKYGYWGTLIYNLIYALSWLSLLFSVFRFESYITPIAESFLISFKVSPSIQSPADIQAFFTLIKQVLFTIASYYLIILVLMIFAWKSVSRQVVRFVPQFEELADPTGHFNRGVVYQKRGMWYLSMLEWERAVKLNPRDSTYRHALGLIYEQMKRPADALQQFEQALSEDPNNLRIGQDRDRLVQTLRA
ncbi:tetratricopeptide repeat protein [Herpetosiphon gulosus]|uniref:Tetratricopeptide repeat protein n=1 Tax=Herpetosiphon gulosus TaxID=1973496 RepID=A0ABP9WUB5_9CHLR